MTVTPQLHRPDLEHVDPRLVDRLVALGDDYGPLGVALAAAALTDPDALVARLIDGAPEPIERNGAYMPARIDDPSTSQRSARRIVRSLYTPRFSRRSIQSQLLHAFSTEGMMTAQQAALVVKGEGAPLAQIETARRRVSDLAAARYVVDSGSRRRNPGSPDESIVWRITTTGYACIYRLRDTGWSRPARDDDADPS